MLTFDECTQLKKIYTQLYPTATISHISHFYIHCKQVALGGDVIGSVKCGSASSVIMAYWPSQGDDLSNIDYTSRMSVGVVQHYIQHTVSMKVLTIWMRTCNEMYIITTVTKCMAQRITIAREWNFSRYAFTITIYTTASVSSINTRA